MGIEELVADPRGRDEPEPGARKAVIATTPAGTTEPVFVTMPHFDGSPEFPNGKHLHGPCPWTPRIVDDSHYGIPSAGDLALVTFTENREPVISTWWPLDA